MSKEIWLKAEVSGFSIKGGRLAPIAHCGHHLVEDSMVHAALADVNSAADLECWVKGMVNSSNNILVRGDDGVLAPLGKGDGDTHMRYGMLINTARNEYSRDKSIQYVFSKKEAQRICLLEQRYPGCDFNTAALAEALGFEPARMPDKALSQLVHVFNARLSLKKRTLENIDLKAVRADMERAGF